MPIVLQNYFGRLSARTSTQLVCYFAYAMEADVNPRILIRRCSLSAICWAEPEPTEVDFARCSSHSGESVDRRVSHAASASTMNSTSGAGGMPGSIWVKVPLVIRSTLRV